MSTQPEALRLADRLERDPNVNRPATAAELRRLSIENDALGLHLSERMKDLARVEAQRDALLKALRWTARALDHDHPAAIKARAVIKAVEEET